MSNNIFPDFQGFSWEKKKTPYWNTTIKEGRSGIETRVQNWRYPRYKIELNYNFMTDNSEINKKDVALIKGDLENLEGFFNSVGGPAQDFLYKDDVENFCEKQSFGIGDGTTKEFQLVRHLPNWVEPINGIVEAPLILIDGVETTEFTFDNYGTIYFNSAPAANAVLSWSGSYYFRVRFEEDDLELDRSEWEGIWEDITIKMVTVK